MGETQSTMEKRPYTLLLPLLLLFFSLLLKTRKSREDPKGERVNTRGLALLYYLYPLYPFFIFIFIFNPLRNER
jgi:hypothetical protein